MSELIDLRAHESLLKQAIADGDAAAVLRLAREINRHAPDHAGALLTLADHALQSADFASAVDLYGQAGKHAPGDWQPAFGKAMALYGLQDFPGALTALDACLRLRPDHLQALLYSGYLRERQGQQPLAVALLLRATRVAERMPRESLNPETLKFLGYARQRVGSELEGRFDKSLAPVRQRFGDAAIQRVSMTASIFLGHRPPDYSHPKWRPALMYIPGLPPRPFLERDEIPWIARLEQATAGIRTEMQAVMAERQGFAPYINHPAGSPEAAVWKTLNQSDNWSTFHFFRNGQRYEDNCARCPYTTGILDSLDLMRVDGYGPEAMFSVLRPQTSIARHYGSVNGRLVIHLPLLVPPDCGALSVAGEARSWTEGQCLVFDDSFEHEAWNQSGQTRVVLIVDTWNPRLTAAEREAFAVILVVAQQFEQQCLKLLAVQTSQPA